MEDLVRYAITNRRMLSLTYKELHRVIEPYVYGIHKNGQQVLWAYQTQGDSLGGEEGWREFLLYQVHDIKLLSEPVSMIRNDYKIGKVDLDIIYCEINNR